MVVAWAEREHSEDPNAPISIDCSAHVKIIMSEVYYLPLFIVSFSDLSRRHDLVLIEPLASCIMDVSETRYANQHDRDREAFIGCRR